MKVVVFYCLFFCVLHLTAQDNHYLDSIRHIKVYGTHTYSFIYKMNDTAYIIKSFWSNSNKILQSQVFKNDSLTIMHGENELYSGGKLMSKENYRDNIQEGWQYYYNKDYLDCKKLFKNGDRAYTDTCFFESGKVASVLSVNAEGVRTRRTFYESGELESRQQRKDRILIEDKCFDKAGKEKECEDGIVGMEGSSYFIITPAKYEGLIVNDILQKINLPKKIDKKMIYQITLKLTIDPFGNVSNITVQKSSGYIILDEVVLNAAKTNLKKFIPAQVTKSNAFMEMEIQLSIDPKELK